MDTMPSKTTTLANAARKLMLDRRDLDNVANAGIGLGIFFLAGWEVVLRLGAFLLMPLSVLVLYPKQRAIDLREAERDQAVAELVAKRAAQGGQ